VNLLDICKFYDCTSNCHGGRSGSVATLAGKFGFILRLCVDYLEDTAVLSALDLKLARGVLKHKQKKKYSETCE
jgi:hypothetical protein